MYLKPKIQSIIYIAVFISACGYNPVRTPFTLSADRYDKTAAVNDSIRLLNWNIHKEGNTHEWEKAIARIVKAKAPDFLVLQEVRLEANVGSFISENLHYGWKFSPNVYQGYYDAYSGVLTASHIKPKTVTSALSEKTELFSEIKKILQCAKFTVGSPSSELLVINIHAINFNIRLDGFKEQMRCIAAAIMEHDGPVIVAGDFNTWRGDRLELLAKLAAKMRLEKVDFGADADHIAAMFGNTLDHIYISRDTLEVIDGTQEVIADIKPSDHSPLFVELRLKRTVASTGVEQGKTI